MSVAMSICVMQVWIAAKMSTSLTGSHSSVMICLQLFAKLCGKRD
jgi:hypothetical protein